MEINLMLANLCSFSYMCRNSWGYLKSLYHIHTHTIYIIYACIMLGDVKDIGKGE